MNSTIDLRADLNQEDDNGHNWCLITDAVDQSVVSPGAILKAGTETFWAWVRVDAIDHDGQVHFSPIQTD